MFSSLACTGEDSIQGEILTGQIQDSSQSPVMVTLVSKDWKAGGAIVGDLMVGNNHWDSLLSYTPSDKKDIGFGRINCSSGAYLNLLLHPNYFTIQSYSVSGSPDAQNIFVRNLATDGTETITRSANLYSEFRPIYGNNIGLFEDLDLSVTVTPDGHFSGTLNYNSHILKTEGSLGYSPDDYPSAGLAVGILAGSVFCNGESLHHVQF
jgi:hypothetical protein